MIVSFKKRQIHLHFRHTAYFSKLDELRIMCWKNMDRRRFRFFIALGIYYCNNGMLSHPDKQITVDTNRGNKVAGTTRTNYLLITLLYRFRYVTDYFQIKWRHLELVVFTLQRIRQPFLYMACSYFNNLIALFTRQ